MLSRKSLAVTAVVGALTLGAVVPTAFAQEAAEEATTESSEATREDRHAAQREEFAAALAEELDLDADTVAAALERVQTAMQEERRAAHRAQLQQRLDAAVEDGSLTREQADALLAAEEAGVLGGVGGRGGHGPGARGFGGGGFGGFDGPPSERPGDAATTRT